VTKGLAETRAVFELPDVLLADVRTDTIVASRDLQISDASFVRLRRAMHWVACANRCRIQHAQFGGGRSATRRALRPKMTSPGRVETLRAGARHNACLSSDMSSRRPSRINIVPTRRMDKLSICIGPDGSLAPTSPLPSGALLELLLSDIATDMEVVARESDLRDAMRERLRRALDRLICAQAVVEAGGSSRLGNNGGEVWERVSEAVRVLTGIWPQDYPKGAVEWLLTSA
jgi:hypothetical protein